MLKRIFSKILLTMLLATLISPFGIQSIERGGESDGFEAQSTSVDWWPMFRHDLSHTGYSTSWAPNTNQTLWSYTTSGAVGSSPAVADGKVYVGSADNKVYALDYLTGGFLWSYATDGDVDSSPAVAYGMVFVGSYDNKVYALSATTGALIWSYPTNGWVVSSPAVADGKVFVGSYDNKVYALDAFTGAFIWSYTTGGYVHSSPAVADGKVYVGSADYKVYALDASTGAYIWSYTTHERVYSSPAYSYNYGMVYVGSIDGNVYALDALTGEEWWSYPTGQNVLSSPAYSVDYYNVYVGSYYDNGKVWALDAYNGDLVWSRTTGNFSVVSSPAVAFGNVYVGSNDLYGGKDGEVIGKVYALDASTGETVWSYTTSSGVTSSPAVADGKVFVGSGDTKVYAFGIPVLSAWAYRTPTIDGEISEGIIAYIHTGEQISIPVEWRSAARVDFTLKYEAESHPATLYVMNDYINLYLALEVRDEDYDNSDVAAFSFDNDHDGIREVGDNYLKVQGSYGGSFGDEFWAYSEAYNIWYADVDTWDGGSNDGVGDAGWHMSEWHFEVAYPLNSDDNDHDFSLSVGSSVGFNLAYYDDGGAKGWSAWPSFDWAGMATIRIAGPPTPPPPSNVDLSITRIEVTQAIQDLYNSLRLVCGKATAVRVYVDIGPTSGPIDVTVFVYGYGSVHGSLGALQKSFSARRYPNRGLTTHTANFLLPMSWTQDDYLYLKAFVKASSASQSETNYNNNWMAEQGFFFYSTTVPYVYIVPINRGTASSPNLPAERQIAAAESYFKTIYPVENVNFIQTTPIIAAGHSDELNRDLEWFYIEWIALGCVEYHPLDQVYGFHSGDLGVAAPLYTGGLGIASSGGGGSMSHEIDHNWGTWVPKDYPTNGWGWGGHVPFGGPTNFLDLSWPYPDGTIQEFGFDTRTMTVIGATTSDLMTYTHPRWISPYRWEAAFDLLQRGYRLSTVGDSMGTIQQAGESLMISGWVSSNGSGSLDPIFRIPSLVQSNSTPGIYALVLQDSAGNALLTHSFKSFINVDSEEDDPHHFFMVLPHISGTAQVLLTYENTTILDKIVMSQNAPTATVLSPNCGETWEPGVQTIEWTASDLDGDSLTYQVFYSTDNGTVWRPISLSITQTYYEVDASFIPGSNGALIKVVASDGFNIGEDSSDTVFTVTDKLPTAKILQPTNESQFYMDDVILLRGRGNDVDDIMLPEAAYNWTSDLDGYLGNGSALTTMLTPGTHRITLTVTDSAGHNASDTITIHVKLDIDILSVTPSETVVGVGTTVKIDVVVKNQGPINQTFDLTTYYNQTLIQTRIISDLPSGNSTTIQFTWNTTDVPAGPYTISATAALTQYEVTQCARERVTIVGVHDVAIITVTASATKASVNQLIYINVTAENQGNYTETFNVSVYYTRLLDPLIGTQQVATLTTGKNKTLTFEWTSNMTGRYEILANTTEIPYDINPADNFNTTIVYVGHSESDLSSQLTNVLHMISLIFVMLGSVMVLGFRKNNQISLSGMPASIIKQNLCHESRDNLTRIWQDQMRRQPI